MFSNSAMIVRFMSTLFDPIKVVELNLPNRIVFAADAKPIQRSGAGPAALEGGLPLLVDAGKSSRRVIRERRQLRILEGFFSSRAMS